MPFISSVRGSLSATGRGAIRRKLPPTWTTAAGSLGTTFDSQRESKSYTVSASPSESGTIAYSVASGSLPTGMSLTSANGFIGGTASSVGSNTVSTFTIRATESSSSEFADRQFTIEVKAPQVVQFTATGSTTFSVPTGITSVQVLVVGAGGAGGAATGFEAGGGGGAGGVLYSASTPVTPGGSVPVTVGTGGTGGQNQSTNPLNSSPAYSSGPGGNSSFGPLTAIGGGVGGGQYWEGRPGGSGGGHAGNAFGNFGAGTPGQGNPGGGAGGAALSASTGSGGGGATQAGTPSGPPGQNPAPGGAGAPYSITGSSVLYGGGGGGACNQTGVGPGAGGPGGGGAGSSSQSSSGTPGTTNRGGGGGGACGLAGNFGGNGGPGIVIVRF